MNESLQTVYTAGSGLALEQRNRVLRNTYWLLALSLIPTVLGAWIGVSTGIFSTMSPGISQRPRPSNVVAPAGTSVDDAGPTRSISASRMITVWSRSTRLSIIANLSNATSVKFVPTPPARAS